MNVNSKNQSNHLKNAPAFYYLHAMNYIYFSAKFHIKVLKLSIIECNECEWQKILNVTLVLVFEQRESSSKSGIIRIKDIS